MVIAFTIAAVVALAGCMPASTATITVQPEVAGKSVGITGRTDLPEGAALTFRAIQKAGFDASASDDGPIDLSPWIRDTSITVAGGSFEGRLDLSDWASGPVDLVVLFDPASAQPKTVTDRFGVDGERLTGPQVVSSASDGRYLEVDSEIQLP